MEGIISNFRLGKHTKSENQMVILVGAESKEEAKKFIGKKVTWKSPAGKEIKGEITAPHGNKGAVKVRFEKGMPGQAISQKVVIE